MPAGELQEPGLAARSGDARADSAASAERQEDGAPELTHQSCIAPSSTETTHVGAAWVMPAANQEQDLLDEPVRFAGAAGPKHDLQLGQRDGVSRE